MFKIKHKLFGAIAGIFLASCTYTQKNGDSVTQADPIDWGLKVDFDARPETVETLPTPPTPEPTPTENSNTESPPRECHNFSYTENRFATPTFAEAFTSTECRIMRVIVPVNPGDSVVATSTPNTAIAIINNNNQVIAQTGSGDVRYEGFNTTQKAKVEFIFREPGSYNVEVTQW